MSSSRDIEKRLRELIIDDTINCTKSELQKFMDYGYILQSGSNYVLRNGKQIGVIFQKISRFTIDLTGVISKGTELAKLYRCNRVYYMNRSTYNQYMDLGYIKEYSGINYYEKYKGEQWVVQLI